jgi:hypothetical protein
MGSTPSPPNPQQTAASQTAENVDTAIANNAMSHVNQTDAWGDQTTYNKTGTTSMYDPEGNVTYQLPEYSESTTLSPTEQQIYGNLQQADLGAGQTADSLISQTKNGLAQPLNLENPDLTAGNVNNYISTNWEQPFQYQEGQQQEQLNQNLADQGININDPAYQTAQQNFGQQEQLQQDTYANSMYSQASQNILNSANSYNQNQVTERNQPVNELSALLSQSQVSNPTFQQTQTPQIPTTDFAQIQQQSYQDQLAASQQSNSLMGSMFGLGGSILGGLFGMSDRRVKRDVRRIGSLANGLPVYSFRFLWDDAEHVGLMADEVARVHPDAVVIGPDGLARVNYAKAVL